MEKRLENHSNHLLKYQQSAQTRQKPTAKAQINLNNSRSLLVSQNTNSVRDLKQKHQERNFILENKLNVLSSENSPKQARQPRPYVYIQSPYLGSQNFKTFEHFFDVAVEEFDKKTGAQYKLRRINPAHKRHLMSHRHTQPTFLAVSEQITPSLTLKQDVLKTESEPINEELFEDDNMILAEGF